MGSQNCELFITTAFCFFTVSKAAVRAVWKNASVTINFFAFQKYSSPLVHEWKQISTLKFAIICFLEPIIEISTNTLPDMREPHLPSPWKNDVNLVFKTFFKQLNNIDPSVINICHWNFISLFYRKKQNLSCLHLHILDEADRIYTSTPSMAGTQVETLKEVHWILYRIIYYTSLFVTTTICIPAANLIQNDTIYQPPGGQHSKISLKNFLLLFGKPHNRQSSQKSYVDSFHLSKVFLSIHPHADTVCVITTCVFVYIFANFFSTLFLNYQAYCWNDWKYHDLVSRCFAVDIQVEICHHGQTQQPSLTLRNLATFSASQAPNRWLSSRASLGTSFSFVPSRISSLSGITILSCFFEHSTRI